MDGWKGRCQKRWQGVCPGLKDATIDEDNLNEFSKDPKVANLLDKRQKNNVKKNFHCKICDQKFKIIFRLVQPTVVGDSAILYSAAHSAHSL